MVYAMKLINVIKAEGHLISALYDLVHVPRNPLYEFSYILYLGEYSKYLYIAYYLDYNKCWDKLLKCIVLGNENLCKNKCIKKIYEVFDSINLFKWSEIEEIFNSVAQEVEEIFHNTINNYRELLNKIFGFNNYFKKVYVLYGFNPADSLLGSMLYWERDYVIVSAFVNPSHTANKITDLIYHEVLHGLIRLNNIELHDDVEELIIDALTPEGYLSKLIGLSNKVKDIDENNITAYVRAYFSEKLYDKGIKLLDFIRSLREPGYRL